jgi:hypothetical protein
MTRRIETIVSAVASACLLSSAVVTSALIVLYAK